MNLKIITPDKLLFEGKVRLVKLPGTVGSFEILKNHAPIISTLTKGRITVKETNGIITYFEINGGLVEGVNNEISVLVES